MTRKSMAILLLGSVAAFALSAANAPAKPAKKPETKTAAVSPPAGNAQPSLLGQYGSWGAYTANPNGHKVCFALAKPTASQTTPPGRSRDPAFVFVSNRPAEKVKDEVSVIIGYPFKPSSEATIEIGASKFGMYTQNDGAWIKNASDEPKLVETMRKGADMVVKGMSGHGTHTSDTFSLKGLQQALDRIGQECAK